MWVFYDEVQGGPFKWFKTTFERVVSTGLHVRFECDGSQLHVTDTSERTCSVVPPTTEDAERTYSVVPPTEPPLFVHKHHKFAAKSDDLKLSDLTSSQSVSAKNTFVKKESGSMGKTSTAQSNCKAEKVKAEQVGLKAEQQGGLATKEEKQMKSEFRAVLRNLQKAVEQCKPREVLLLCIGGSNVGL